jgi:hypothetical protein
MNSVCGTIFQWARKTTSSLMELHFLPTEPPVSEDAPADGLIYRLKHWPDLPCHHKTADVLRVLSVMSNRPVNRHWILANSKLRGEQVDRLLQRLVDDGAVDVIDASQFASA